VEEWNGIWNQEWDIHLEWNEIYFISFMVADQDALRQLSRIHGVDGTYYWEGMPPLSLGGKWTGMGQCVVCMLPRRRHRRNWWREPPLTLGGGKRREQHVDLMPPPSLMLQEWQVDGNEWRCRIHTTSLMTPRTSGVKNGWKQGSMWDSCRLIVNRALPPCVHRLYRCSSSPRPPAWPQSPFINFLPSHSSSPCSGDSQCRWWCLTWCGSWHGHGSLTLGGVGGKGSWWFMLSGGGIGLQGA